MTPGQARGALVCFSLVAIGVAGNALLLQPRPAPAGRSVEQSPARTAIERPHKAQPPAARPERPATRRPASAAGEPPPLHIARFAPDRAKLEGVPDMPFADGDGETVRAIQRELEARGYGPVAADGVAGLSTRAAIMAFEHDQGSALTAEASERTLKRILLGASAGGDLMGTGRVRSAQAEEVVRTAQQLLLARGYAAGTADGRLRPDTLQAIRDFELDKGLVPRGRISAELVARLSLPATPARSAAR
jgi:peptidoglycan hydrolase-like protein with peptidoglycan-binding domain